MFILVERYFERAGKAENESALLKVLGELSSELGYRSGFIIEYGRENIQEASVLDTSPNREGWWQRYVQSGVRKGMDEARQKLATEGGVLSLDISEFADPDDAYLQFARKADLVQTTVIPVVADAGLMGLVGFSGTLELTNRVATALELISYTLFLRMRELRLQGIHVPKASLTPRESEVMDLAAEGYTSSEIASELGMSARTVNQHVENVAQKLGTKNRVQTVAEVIRHGLL